MPESTKRKKVTQSANTTPQAPKADLPSPRWWAPTMVTLMVLGLIWVVVTYLLSGQYPIPGLGNWNLAIGGGIVLTGFLMTLGWK